MSPIERIYFRACMTNKEKLMTGQEWYMRFYKEIHDGENHVDDTKSYYIGYILEAAKRAAGLEKESEDE